MPGSQGINPYARMIEDAEGLDKIEALQVRCMKCITLHCITRQGYVWVRMLGAVGCLEWKGEESSS